MSVNIINIDQVKNAIYLHGIYPALYLLRELQDNEQYEQCNIIKKALDEIMNGREYGITTKVDDKSLEENYQIITESIRDAELFEHNLPKYINGFKKTVCL